MKTDFSPRDGTRALDGPVALAALWAVGVLLVYSASCPNPFPLLGDLFRSLGPAPPSFSGVGPNLLLHLRALATAAAVLAILLGVGKDLRRAWRIGSDHPWSDLAIETALGFVALTAAWMGLGLVRLWFPSVLALAGALTALWAVRGWIATHPPALRAPAKTPPPSDRAYDLGTGLLIGIGWCLVALDLLQNLVPETFYDSLGYLLAVPQAWIQNHGVTDLTGNFCSGLYSASGVLYSIGLMLEGTPTAKLLGTAAVPACALLAGGWVARSHGRDAGRLALGATLTLPILHLNTWAARADLWMTFFILLAWWAVDRWCLFTKPGSERFAFLAGLAAGSAIAVKSVALLAFIPVPFVAFAAFKSGRFVRKGFPWAVAGFLLVTAPWIMKNLAFTGNPAFPYLQDLFGGRMLEPGTLQTLLAKNGLFKPSGLREWLTLPWDMVMPGSGKGQMAGPLALAVLPFLLLGFRKIGSYGKPLLTALLFLGVGLAVSRNIRFYLSAFIVLGCAFAILSAGWKSRHARRAGLLVCLAAALLPLPFLVSVLSEKFDPVAVWRGRETRDDYLTRKMANTYMPMARWTAQNLPKDSLLLVAGDVRALYYGVPVRANWVDDTQDLVAAAKGSTDAAGVQRALKRLGVTHLAVNGREGLEVALTNFTPYRLNRQEWARLTDWLGRYTGLVWREGFSAVYEIKPEPSKPRRDFNALSLLSGPAAVWWDHQNRPAGNMMLDAQLSLFPGDKFWQEQAAHSARQMKPINNKKRY